MIVAHTPSDVISSLYTIRLTLDMNPNSRSWLRIDGTYAGNELSRVNDYRGWASRPNAKYSYVYAGGLLRVVLVSLERIEAGQQILVDCEQVETHTSTHWLHALLTTTYGILIFSIPVQLCPEGRRVSQ